MGSDETEVFYEEETRSWDKKEPEAEPKPKTIGTHERRKISCKHKNSLEEVFGDLNTGCPEMHPGLRSVQQAPNRICRLTNFAQKSSNNRLVRNLNVVDVLGAPRPYTKVEKQNRRIVGYYAVNPFRTVEIAWHASFKEEMRLGRWGEVRGSGGRNPRQKLVVH